MCAGSLGSHAGMRLQGEDALLQEASPSEGKASRGAPAAAERMAAAVSVAAVAGSANKATLLPGMRSQALSGSRRSGSGRVGEGRAAAPQFQASRSNIIHAFILLSDRLHALALAKAAPELAIYLSES